MSFGFFNENKAAVPKAHDIDLALQSSKKLAAFLPKQKKDEVKMTLKTGNREAHLVLPFSALKLFLQILTEMAEGNAVTLIPIHAELTTQEAANLLNISRPFLIKLLETGKIPFHKVGAHRRIKFQDLVQFQKSYDASSKKSLDELSKQAQKFDLGY